MRKAEGPFSQRGCFCVRVGGAGDFTSARQAEPEASLGCHPRTAGNNPRVGPLEPDARVAQASLVTLPAAVSRPIRPDVVRWRASLSGNIDTGVSSVALADESTGEIVRERGARAPDFGCAPTWDGRYQSVAVDLHASVALRPNPAHSACVPLACQSSGGGDVTSRMGRRPCFSVAFTAGSGTRDRGLARTETALSVKGRSSR